MNIAVEVNKIIPTRFVYQLPDAKNATEFNKKIDLDQTMYNILTAMKIDTDNPNRPEKSLKLDYKRFSELVPTINTHLKELRIAITTSSTAADDAAAYKEAMIPFILVRL